MHITRITALNMKGGSLDVTLDRANVIHGDNFAGKTRIADAVRLALLGYLPELGKRNADTFGLASGPTMEVRAEFDNGATIKRVWSAKGDGVKMDTVGDGNLGSQEILTVMLNAEEYFALSDKKRVEYIFANLPVEAMDRETIQARVGDYGLADAYARIDEWDEKIRKAPKPANPQDELGALIEEARTDWKNSKDNADRMQKTVQGLVQLRADDPGRPTMASLQDRRAELAREIETLTEQKGRNLSSFTQMTSDRQRRAAIDREVSFSAKSRLDLVDAKEAQALIVAKLAQTPAVLMSDIEAALGKVGDLNNRARQCNTERDQIANSRASITAQASNLVTQKVCPYCGATGEGWKALRAAEYATELEKQDAEWVSIGQREEPLLVSLKAATVALEDLKARREQRTALESKLSLVQGQIARLEPQLARVIALNEEAARLMPEDPELTAAVESVQTRLNILSQEARGADRLIEEATGRENDLARLAKAEEERDASLKLKADAEAAGKKLLDIQSEMVEAAFKPLLSAANAIFGSVLPSPLEYRDGEIGTRREGTWVGHKTFSGAEKALTYAAIQAALAARSPVRLMILDEMGKFIGANARMVAVEIIAALSEARLDQAILIDPERLAPYNGMAMPVEFSFRHHAIG